MNEFKAILNSHPPIHKVRDKIQYPEFTINFTGHVTESLLSRVGENIRVQQYYR